MKRRFLAFLLALLICVGSVATVLAAPQSEAGITNDAGAPLFDDIAHHWAREQILACASSGLVNGVGGTTFAPDLPLTRGMFVTILGRLLHVDTTVWAVRSGGSVFEDVKPTAFYAPYVNWALHNGITKGVTDTTFAPDQYVTRQQMAAFVSRTAALTNHALRILDEAVDVPDAFADQDQIASWADSPVRMLKNVGVLTGVPNEDGSVSFLPNKTATRAEGCVVFERLSRALVPLEPEQWVEPQSITILNPISKLEPQQAYMAQASVYPVYVSNPTLTWSSASPEVISITPDGVMTWRSVGYAMITVTASNGLYTTMFVQAVEPPKPSYGFNGESEAQKMTRIFGGVVSNPRTVYRTPAEAEAHMATITVPAWRLDSNGNPYSTSYSLTVHENIAPTILQIFREIYADPSRPPIKNVGGYRFCAVSESEHTSGLAIDINWEENYYCSADGTPLTGKYFKPGEDPYSIPVDGVIQQIFRKYGFTRGIYWRNGTKDYMHFSYFGT